MLAQINWRGLQDAIGGRFRETATIGSIINILIPYIFVFAGLLLLLYLLYGGYQYLFSAGDPRRAQVAKDNITGALIGFAIVFAAYWIVRIAATVLGLTDIQSTFQ
ncbi:hypothetical protein HY008_00395 [Candidatus Woesebacteria bacterium]|nr:hypothetical protein [Candidatus Woesebacteria bacterium]